MQEGHEVKEPGYSERVALRDAGGAVDVVGSVNGAPLWQSQRQAPEGAHWERGVEVPQLRLHHSPEHQAQREHDHEIERTAHAHVVGDDDVGNHERKPSCPWLQRNKGKTRTRRNVVRTHDEKGRMW